MSSYFYTFVTIEFDLNIIDIYNNGNIYIYIYIYNRLHFFYKIDIGHL